MKEEEFLKGIGNQRKNYIILHAGGDRYTAYGEDAIMLQHFTNGVLTHTEDKEHLCFSFAENKLLKGGGDGCVLPRLLNHKNVVFVDKNGEVFDLCHVHLDEGYEFQPLDAKHVQYNTGAIVVHNIPLSQYLNGVRVKKEGDGRLNWAFVMYNKSNRGYSLLYSNRNQHMTGDCAMSYACGMANAERNYHKRSFVLMYVLLNNGLYFIVQAVNAPLDFCIDGLHYIMGNTGRSSAMPLTINE